MAGKGITRIIAERTKGAQLTAPRCGTRPTSDRVREVLFPTLVTWFDTTGKPAERHLVGVVALDLCTGTGAVALEAASRGVSRVVAVDSHTSDLIADNACRVGLRIEAQGGRAGGRIPAGPWDLVFVDPPYEMDSALLGRTPTPLFSPGKLNPQALVAVKCSRRCLSPVRPDGPGDDRCRGYGETSLYLAAAKPAGES